MPIVFYGEISMWDKKEAELFDEFYAWVNNDCSINISLLGLEDEEILPTDALSGEFQDYLFNKWLGVYYPEIYEKYKIKERVK